MSSIIWVFFSLQVFKIKDWKKSWWLQKIHSTKYPFRYQFGPEKEAIKSYNHQVTFHILIKLGYCCFAVQHYMKKIKKNAIQRIFSNCIWINLGSFKCPISSLFFSGFISLYNISDSKLCIICVAMKIDFVFVLGNEINLFNRMEGKTILK